MPIVDLDVLLTTAETEVVLAKSDWLADGDGDLLRRVIAEHSTFFDQALQEFVDRLGPPDFSEATDPALRDELYPEAMRIAGWRRENAYRLLVLGQHDRETPVFVSFSQRELDS